MVFHLCRADAGVISIISPSQDLQPSKALSFVHHQKVGCPVSKLCNLPRLSLLAHNFWFGVHSLQNLGA
jgi:hypothetical protein